MRPFRSSTRAIDRFRSRGNFFAARHSSKDSKTDTARAKQGGIRGEILWPSWTIEKKSVSLTGLDETSL